ncbi:diguanylate cyclase [Leptolyngbya sp. Cla-17]|uniref:diguanylate cyclase n=1 Tax=Leptolyngbya sp. Cla-17 TaxID=2803751 RepID=UPI0018D5AA27|nr:diguanylate cyclase [Leptolyngbya sp. Cla-17]
MSESCQFSESEALHLMEQIQRLREDVERLKREREDLSIALSTTAEHGDCIEAQLQEANQRLQVEVEVRRRTEITLQALMEAISKRKADLEIVVQTIMEHGDIMDTQWSLKLSEMNKIASIDGLTQIPNRRRFDEHLEHQWKQMTRERSPICLILFDIDHFKQFNDTYGHLAGDDCLKQVAQVLNGCAHRPSDLIARYGGEEFAAILPQTTIEGAMEVAGRVQAEISDLKILHEKSSVSKYLTLSIGIASSIPTLEQSFSKLLDEADQYLYLAKQQGRDRIIFSSKTTLRQ